jgi:hypothetical protein
MAAESRRAAALDRRHHLQQLVVPMTARLSAPVRLVHAPWSDAIPHCGHGRSNSERRKTALDKPDL